MHAIICLTQNMTLIFITYKAFFVKQYICFCSDLALNATRHQPVFNTGVFLIGCLLFFMETISAWADAAGLGANVGQFMILGLVGANFIFELLFNAVLSPVIVRLIRIGKKEVE